MGGDDIPVRMIHNLQHELRIAVASKQWDACPQLVDDILVQLKLAMDIKTAQTGLVHLDGVYRVGTMSYSSAPDRAKRSLNKMNRIIRTAERSLK